MSSTDARVRGFRYISLDYTEDEDVPTPLRDQTIITPCIERQRERQPVTCAVIARVVELPHDTSTAHCPLVPRLVSDVSGTPSLCLSRRSLTAMPFPPQLSCSRNPVARLPFVFAPPRVWFNPPTFAPCGCASHCGCRLGCRHRCYAGETPSPQFFKYRSAGACSVATRGGADPPPTPYALALRPHRYASAEACLRRSAAPPGGKAVLRKGLPTVTCSAPRREEGRRGNAPRPSLSQSLPMQRAPRFANARTYRKTHRC